MDNSLPEPKDAEMTLLSDIAEIAESENHSVLITSDKSEPAGAVMEGSDPSSNVKYDLHIQRTFLTSVDDDTVVLESDLVLNPFHSV